MVTAFAPSSPLTNMQELSKRQQKLIQQCRNMRFGRIHNLHVTNGEPSFRPPPRVEKTIRLGRPLSKAKPPPQARLTEQEEDLLRVIREIEEGVILEIVIREGQPCDIRHEEVL